MNEKELKRMIAEGGTSGQRLLASGMSVNSLRTNATLRKDEWKHYDTAAIKAAQRRLVGIADLMSRGLTYSLANGLGTTVLEYEDMSDVNDAQLSLDAVSRGQSDAIEFDLNYLPLPIVHADFDISIRKLNASRTTGQPLDTLMIAAKAEKIAEKLESILFTGASTFTFGGGTIYGYTDFPHRNTGSLSANWDDSTATGATILADVVAMKQASINDRHYGPWVLYIPTAYETVLDEDYVSGYPKTIRDRLLEVGGISEIKVVDLLTANNVLLVEMDAKTVRLVEGLPLTTVEWQTQGNMVFNFKLMTISVPQLRADQANRCGIQHWT